MSADVLVKVRNDDVSLALPPKCVYCGRDGEKYVPLEAGKLGIRLGEYSSSLAQKYHLPWINDAIYAGFTIYAGRGGGQRRTWSIRWKFKTQVPYCREHYDLIREIERTAPPGKWLLLALPGALLGASAGGFGLITLGMQPGWLTENTLVLAVAGVFVGVGLAYPACWLFGPKRPGQRGDYLKMPPLSVSGKASLGCRFLIEHKRALTSFLDDPYIVVRCTFVNAEYAKLFARECGGEVVQEPK
jgi:hypothetical protein